MRVREFVNVKRELLSYLCAAYFNDIVVGRVRCQTETEGDQRRLYIMTLGVLAPYHIIFILLFSMHIHSYHMHLGSTPMSLMLESYVYMYCGLSS